jgi:hypothetical protein
MVSNEKPASASIGPIARKTVKTKTDVKKI